MSCEYIWKPNPGKCHACGRDFDAVLIGVASAGHEFAQNDPPQGFPSWRDFIEQRQDVGVIVDEYGREVRPNEMVDIISGTATVHVYELIHWRAEAKKFMRLATHLSGCPCDTCTNDPLRDLRRLVLSLEDVLMSLSDTLMRDRKLSDLRDTCIRLKEKYCAKRKTEVQFLSSTEKEGSKDV